jgi:hypothetical protein
LDIDPIFFIFSGMYLRKALELRVRACGTGPGCTCFGCRHFSGLFSKSVGAKIKDSLFASVTRLNAATGSGDWDEPAFFRFAEAGLLKCTEFLVTD